MYRSTVFIFASLLCYAPFASASASDETAVNPSPLLLSTDPGANRFLPVGKLRTGDGSYHCTASVIAGADTPAPTRRALIVTAGHCVEESGR